jgi:MutS domain V
MIQEASLPSNFFVRRAQEIDLAADEANRRYSAYQVSSIVFLLATVASVYAPFATKDFPFWLIILPAAAFIATSKKALAQRRLVLRLLSIREYYDKATARLLHQWDSLDEGKDFIDPQHMYATDLDLFGRGSLFQLLCSARTHAGRETLASWLKNGAAHDEVLARQAAVAELRERNDVREALAGAGKSSVFTLRPRTIRAWVDEIVRRPELPAWARPTALAIVLALAAIPFLYWFGHISLQTVWFLLAGWLGTELAFSAIFMNNVQFIVESVDSPSTELPIIADLLELIESQRFSSPKLIAIAERVKQTNGTASGEVRRLNRLVRLLQLRNMLVLLSVLLWCTQLATAIDRWHRRHGADLIEWLTAIGEFEALVSLSAYAFEHPNDVFPELTERGPTFAAQALGHPLLDERTCVTNDISLDDDTRFLIISGSNMSGKSTFLRAVGANAVLAWTGAPVRCAQLRISKLAIAAAIRVQDSLADGQSHFFAEMKRLRRMIDLAAQSPTLFLVDEIMSGTNSKDRRVASEWVMRALIRRGAIGLISTHDLTLTEIASNGLPGRNVFFEDTGEGGQLHFDYKLRPGLLTHSNALNIVRMLGINTET